MGCKTPLKGLRCTKLFRALPSCGRFKPVAFEIQLAAGIEPAWKNAEGHCGVRSCETANFISQHIRSSQAADQGTAWHRLTLNSADFSVRGQASRTTFARPS